jgi:hypothetical protein
MKLARLSRLMSVLSLIGMVVAPVAVVWTFLHPERTRFLMLHLNHVGDRLSSAVPLDNRLEALAIELVPLALAMWALWSLAQVFRCYARGQVFGAEPLRHLNNLAVALAASVIADLAAQLPISLLLSWHLGPHHRELSLSFGSDDVSRLFVAGAVLAMARVMDEARRVADENAGFV